VDLRDYPRPPDDTGIGIHWSAGFPVAVGMGKIREFWLPELRAMGVKWVKIANHDGGLDFAEELIRNEIMPVVRLYRPQPNPGVLSERELRFVEEYVARGVFYFEFNNEPELGNEWQGGHVPPNALEIVARNAIVDMEAIIERGGFPAIPALATGNRWDIVGKICELGREDLFDGPVWQAVHNYGINHPLDYPDDPGNQDGAPYTPEFYEALKNERWGGDAWQGRSLEEVNALRASGKKPGTTILDDASCWRSYEFFDALVRRWLGRSLPVLATEGGYTVGVHADLRYPATTPRLHMAQTLEACRIMMGTSKRFPPAPDYFFCSAFWLLGNYTLGHWAAEWENAAWYSSRWPGGRLPIVDVLKQEPKQERAWRYSSDSGYGIALQGSVTHGAGWRLILARIGNDWRWETTSDEDGSYAFYSLHPGVYTVSVAGTGLRQVVVLSPEKRVETVDFDLSGVEVTPMESEVRGTVAGGAGRTLRLERDGWSAETAADEGGRYRFEKLAAGRYRLILVGTSVVYEDIVLDGRNERIVDLAVPGWGYRVRDGGPGPGFGVIRCSVEGQRDLPVHLWAQGWVGIVANTGSKPEYGDFACEFAPLGAGDYFIEPQGLDVVAEVSLDGSRIVWVEFTESKTPPAPLPARGVITGQVAHGAGRRLLLRSAAGEWTTFVGSDEQFRFEALPTGRYELRVMGSDVRQTDIQVDGDMDTPVVVDLELPPPAPARESAITGVVVGGAGRQLRLIGVGMTLETTAGSDGTFRFENLPAGSFRLEVVGTNVVQQDLVVDGHNHLEVGLAVPATDWTFEVQDGGPGPGFGVVRCSVEGQTNLPVRIWAEGWNGQVQHTGSKPEYGAYACEFAPLGAGRYYLEPEGLGVRATVEVTGERAILVVFQPATVPSPSAQSVLQGSVRNGAGRQVQLRDAEGEIRIVKVADDETYRFTHLRAGVYTLSVPGTSVQQENILLDGTATLTVDLTLLPERSAISGHVYNGQGRTLVLTNAEGSQWTTVVDDNESYRFEGLPAGIYALAVFESDVRQKEIELDGENQVTVELALPVLPPAPEKEYELYLLVGRVLRSRAEFLAALRYAAAFGPVVGDDVEEAKKARSVVILGGTSAVSRMDEDMLQLAGCETHRISENYVEALEALIGSS